MSDCKHEWKFQQDYSRAGSIRRFKCLKCGVWGWNSPPNHWDGFKEKPIRAYRDDRKEPDPSWSKRQRKELPPEPLSHRERTSLEETLPTQMEGAVYGADKFTDPGDC